MPSGSDNLAITSAARELATAGTSPVPEAAPHRVLGSSVLIWAAIVILIALAVVRSAVATKTDGFTVDEAWHIAAGVSYVRTATFALNPEHPPLVKCGWARRKGTPSKCRRCADWPTRLTSATSPRTWSFSTMIQRGCRHVRERRCGC